MNELMTKDNEWIIHFMGSLDRLLDNYERMTADYRPTLGGERFFTDKEVSADALGLTQRGTDSLYPVGRQDSLSRVGHREDAA